MFVSFRGFYQKLQKTEFKNNLCIIHVHYSIRKKHYPSICTNIIGLHLGTTTPINK